MASDESTAQYIYFIGFLTYLIFIIDLTMFSIFTYPKQNWVSDKTKLCGPYDSEDTISSVIMDFLLDKTNSTFLFFFDNIYIKALFILSILTFIKMRRAEIEYKTEKIKQDFDEFENEINFIKKKTQRLEKKI